MPLPKNKDKCFSYVKDKYPQGRSDEPMSKKKAHQQHVAMCLNSDINEAEDDGNAKRAIVVYAGRFHPFHAGHRQVYEHYVAKFGQGNVYVATSGKQDGNKRPFSFNEKKALMVASGVPSNMIFQVKSPYSPTEIYDRIDMDNTAVIFPLGDDDAARLGVGKVNKSGKPSFFQPLDSAKQGLKPVGQSVAYSTSLERFPFKVLGKTIERGTDFRNTYLAANDKQRLAVLTQFYGANKAKTFKKMFDRRIGQMNESLLREFIERIRKF